jgi:hypothetical protein
VLDDDIASHYALGLEGQRLTPDGRPTIELLRTRELLERFVPPVETAGACAIEDMLFAARAVEADRSLLSTSAQILGIATKPAV